MFRKRDTHIHFVGIGGIGMSGIAEVLVNLGYRVTGTDIAASETTARLAQLGATIHRGHAPSHVADADVVVISSAVGRDNPEVIAARQRKIPVIPRAEMLAELMRLKQGIAIAGSHGKTTTTSMVAAVLHAAGIDPTVVIGGKLNGFDANALLGRGDVLLAEADESDGSFLYLSPTWAVITNIDHEHIDHYGNLERLIEAFTGFANRVPFYGAAVVCLDNDHVARMLPQLAKRVITYGTERTDADYVASEIVHNGSHTQFRVLTRGEDRGRFELDMPGLHNVRNALAAIAIADEYHIEQAITQSALARFEGVQRRFTHLGIVDDVMVIDDYGHHPTEIRATLSGARLGFPDRRIIAVVQPHRYSRLRDNFEDFVRCFCDADILVLTDVYPAGERPLPAMDSMRLAEAVRHHDPRLPVDVVSELARLPAAMSEIARPGDLFVTLGAGSITSVGPLLLERLRAGVSETVTPRPQQETPCDPAIKPA